MLVYPIWFGTPPAMMKGHVERVFGAGFSYRAVVARQPHPLLAGRHLLSITSSGTSSTWLDKRGAWRSLRDVFDNYLAQAFSMASCDHLHLESLVEGMAESDVGEKLRRVESLAADMCARLSAEARTAGARPSLTTPLALPAGGPPDVGGQLPVAIRAYAGSAAKGHSQRVHSTCSQSFRVSAPNPRAS